MLYESTRGGCECAYPETLKKGIADNGGLYIPKEWPRLDEKTRARILRARRYIDVAYAVMAPFFDRKTRRSLRHMLKRAYTKGKFGSPIVPVKEIADELYLLEVSEGPTWAFKDMALQLLAELLDFWLQKWGEYLNIIVATSGDTGSAAIEALKHCKRITVTVLSPGKGTMSDLQKKMMYGVKGKNVHNIVIDGDFDDCQNILKAIMADKEFANRHHLGLVNSINWTRIIAQTVYFVWAWSRIAKTPNHPIAFSVPSGNFGDAYSCFVAQQMGLPIIRIVVATNENDVLHRFFETGRYDARVGERLAETRSPSMDIKVASNFERLLAEALERDGRAVALLMEHMKPGADGWFDMKDLPEFDYFAKAGFVSGACSDEETLFSIASTYANYGVIVDPHTAVALAVGQRHRLAGIPLVVVETARWEKFPDTVARALGHRPAIPSRYRGVMRRKQHFVRLPAKVGAVKGELHAFTHSTT